MKCPVCGRECRPEGLKETQFGEFWEYRCPCGFEWRTRKKYPPEPR